MCRSRPICVSHCTLPQPVRPRRSRRGPARRPGRWIEHLTLRVDDGIGSDLPIALGADRESAAASWLRERVRDRRAVRAGAMKRDPKAAREQISTIRSLFPSHRLHDCLGRPTSAVQVRSARVRVIAATRCPSVLASREWTWRRTWRETNTKTKIPTIFINASHATPTPIHVRKRQLSPKIDVRRGRSLDHRNVQRDRAQQISGKGNIDQSPWRIRTANTEKFCNINGMVPRAGIEPATRGFSVLVFSRFSAV
jgi:hypothetical protein